jgi:hypothetical protein
VGRVGVHHRASPFARQCRDLLNLARQCQGILSAVLSTSKTRFPGAIVPIVANLGDDCGSPCLAMLRIRRPAVLFPFHLPPSSAATEG